MRGMMGVSSDPFGDLSDSLEFSEARVAAFLFSNSILSLSLFQFRLALLTGQVNPTKASDAKERRRGWVAGIVGLGSRVVYGF